MSDDGRCGGCFEAFVSGALALANICEKPGCSNSSGRAKTFEALI
jgi:hypothetical protein